MGVFADKVRADWNVIGDGKELSIKDSHLSALTFQAVIEGIGAGWIKTEGLVSHVFRLDEWEKVFLVFHGGQWERKISMKKVVLVGFGGIGRKYAGLIYQGAIEGMELYGILCRNTPGQDEIRKTMPQVKIYGSEEELFAHTREFDALIIATPHREHVRVVKRAAAAGLHLLCEKPFGICAGECSGAIREIQELEMQEAGRPEEPPIHAMVFNWRARQAYARLKEILESGKLGRIHQIIWTANFWYRPEYYHQQAKWRSSWEGEGGGLLINQSQHLMDMWNWLFGQPDSVFSRLRYGKYSHIGVDDEATLLFSYDSGTEGIFFSSTGDSPGTNRLEIYADMGKLTLENDRSMVFLKNTVSTAEVSQNARESNPKIPFVTEAEEILQQKDEYEVILQNFSDAMHGTAEPMASLHDGLKAIQNVNAAYLSDWKKRWQRIPCDEEEYIEELQKRVTETGKQHG